MRKLIYLFLLGMFFVPCAMAATSISVRVSLTIPPHIETGDNDNAKAQTNTNMDAAPMHQQTTITTTAGTIIRADKVYLLQTTLPK